MIGRRFIVFIGVFVLLCVAIGCESTLPAALSPAIEISAAPTVAPTAAPTLTPTPIPTPTPEPTPLPPFGLGQHYATVTLGENLRLALPEGYEALWSSHNERVATVDQSGTVTAVKLGTTEISAQSADGLFTDSCYIRVSARGPLPPLGEIDPPRFVLGQDGIYRNAEGETSGRAEILLTGDIMCVGSQQSAARVGDTYDFNVGFESLRPLFLGADFVIGNLETVLSHSMPWTIEKAKFSEKAPNCNAPNTFLDGVRHGGFDAVVTANNHTLDGGLEGLYETIQQLDSYGLLHTGTGLYAHGPRFLLVEINGLRVAFLSYTMSFNRDGGLSPTQIETMVSRYSPEAVARDCQAAREAGAEFIIAYNHWGQENTRVLTERQRLAAQAMADAGVDMIAGSHPHTLQKVDWLTAHDGRRVLCAYSLGNLLSGMTRAQGNRETAILRLALARDEQGRVGLAGFGYYSCVILKEKGVNFVWPLMYETNSAKYVKQSGRIAKVLGIAAWTDLQ
ncbi:MAG: CapA family protein [Clostridiales bacterium]|nr:CapA family protein [Clostridiales bacterium]